MKRINFPQVDYDFYHEPSFYHKKHGMSSVYNFQNCQLMSNSQNKFYNFKLPSQNAVPAVVQGNFVDFKLDSVPGFIYKSFVLSYTVTNNTGAAVNLISGPMQISTFQVLQQGVLKLEHDNYEVFLENALFEDNATTTGHANLKNACINPTDITNTVALANGASQNCLIDLPTFFTHTNLYRPKINGDVVLRINFNSFI